VLPLERTQKFSTARCPAGLCFCDNVNTRAFLLPDNSTDEGLLEFQEIAQLSLSADLVTLSACDTASGKLEGEEGIDGLAEAFLLAGAKSVVGALWEVDDSATRSLMKNFYLHLAQGQDEASALRQAKLDHLRTSANSSSVYWAPFTLIGDGSATIIF